MASKRVHAEIERLRPAFSLKVETERLANGLVLHCAPEPGSGLVSVQFWVKTGSIHEGPHLGAGLSHYLEHLVFKGAGKRAGREISAAIQACGGVLNAYTTFDRTVYYADLPAEHLDTGVSVLADLVFRAHLPEAECERERDVILREIDMTLDEPDTQLWQSVFETAYREHPYKYPVIGYRDLFRRLGRAEALWLRDGRYQPDNVVVVIAGDTETSGALESVGRHAGGVERRSVAPVLVPSEPDQVGERSVRRTASVNLTRGGIGYKIPGLGHEDAAAIDVLASILGSGNSSVLWREAREKLRVVHEVGASAWNPGDGGLLFAAFSSDPGKRDAAVQVVRKVLEHSGDRRFAQSDIDKVVRQVLVHEVQSRRTVSGIASKVGMASVVIGDLAHFDGYLRQLSEVDAAALRRVASKYLRPESLTLCTLDPKAPEAGAVRARPVRSAPVLRELEISGVPVVFQEDHRLPVVHVRALLHGGPAREPRDACGVGALLATLCTRDAGGMSAAKIDRQVESAGGSFFAFAGNNSLGIAAEFLPTDVDLAFERVGLGLSEPSFNPRTIEIEREGQIAGLRDEEDDVVAQGRRLMRERLFGEHPLARSPNGLVATVSNLGAGELREHHGRIVRRGGLVLSIAGAMDEARLRRLATALIRRIPPGAVDASQPPFPPRTRAVRETVRLPREQAVVFLGFPGPGVRDPDFVAAEVAHELFSGMASRLFERVREEKGLAYFIRSGRVVGVDAGGFHFEGGTQAGREGEVLAEIRAEIRRIRSGGATTEELARCHKRLIVARRMQLQTVGSRAMQCGLNQLLGLPVDDTARHEREVSAVDAKRLSAFAKRWFRPAQEVEFVVLPEG